MKVLIIIILLSSFISAVVIWVVMIKYARKYYEKIRDNANIETDQELIQYCNMCLNQINKSFILYNNFKMKWKK